MSKRLLYILIFIFITSCSISKKENEINDRSINLFEKIEPIKKELNPDLKIKSLIKFKNKPFQIFSIEGVEQALRFQHKKTGMYLFSDVAS